MSTETIDLDLEAWIELADHDLPDLDHLRKLVEIIDSDEPPRIVICGRGINIPVETIRQLNEQFKNVVEVARMNNTVDVFNITRLSDPGSAVAAGANGNRIFVLGLQFLGRLGAILAVIAGRCTDPHGRCFCNPVFYRRACIHDHNRPHRVRPHPGHDNGLGRSCRRSIRG